MSTLEVHRLSVEYAGRHGSVSALRGFEVRVPEGGMLVLLGQSGCGKSTALNAIAGLTTPSAGRISLGGDVLFEAGARTVPPERRDISMVFQSYALWPHLSVLDNVTYPLRRRGMAAQAAHSAAREALGVVQCAQFARRVPGELSGGQQQRIALARALVGRPRLLLFDEPLSNLDASLRRELRDELSRLHKQIGFTGVYVTHDQSEALCLATDIAVMDGGRIVQRGTPQDIYEKPATEFVARFFGANVLPGHVDQSDSSGCRVATPAGALPCARTAPAGAVVAAFMPHAVRVLPDDFGPLTISAAIYQGSHQEVRLTAGVLEVTALLPTTLPAAVGQRARIEIPPESIHLYSTAGASP